MSNHFSSDETNHKRILKIYCKLRMRAKKVYYIKYGRISSIKMIRLCIKRSRNKASS